jgi:hypothetical protein
MLDSDSEAEEVDSLHSFLIENAEPEVDAGIAVGTNKASVKHVKKKQNKDPHPVLNDQGDVLDHHFHDA